MAKKSAKMERWMLLDSVLSQGSPVSLTDIYWTLYNNKSTRLIGLEPAKFCALSPEKQEEMFVRTYRASLRKDLDIFKKALEKAGKSDMLVVGRGAKDKEFEPGKDRRTKTYFYAQKGFSVIPLLTYEMSDAEYNRLVGVIDKLEGVLNSQNFEEVKFAIQSRVEADYGKGMNCVEYEDNRRLKGREFRPVIYRAIKERQVLHIHYKTFKGEELEYDFTPYLLKQYNDRWFAFGHTDLFGDYTNIPLDRIESVPIVVGNHNESRPDAYLDYFSNIVGVTKKEAPIQHITIGIHNIDTWGRITTKPLVTQMVSRDFDTESQYGQITLDIIPNEEFFSKVLSWGDHVHIEGPEEVVIGLFDKIKSIYSKYQG